MQGPSINYVVSGREGQKLPILPSKKTTKRGGGGQKSPILLSKKPTKGEGGGHKTKKMGQCRLWMAPKEKPDHQRASKIAHYLRSRGAGDEDRNPCKLPPDSLF